MTDVASLLSARRADLDGGSPTPDVEVIPPADTEATALVPAGAPPAGAVPPSTPAGAVVPADPEPQFPMVPPKVLGGLPYARSYMKLAQTIHNTELVPKAFKQRPDAIMAAMMYGYELGLGPMQALNGLHVIEGKVGQDAELMRALITDAGHLFVLQSGEDEDGEPWATVYCRRKDWPEDMPTGEFSWTLQSGRKAGLVEWYEKWSTTERGGKRKLTWNPHGPEERPAWLDGTGVEHKFASSWQNYGEDMCIARATARAARANFSDVLKGMSYTPEELAEFDGGRETPPTQEAPPSPPPAPTAPAAGQPASPETASTEASAPAPDSASPTRSEQQPEGSSPAASSATDSAPAAPASPPTKAAGPTKKASAKKAAAAKKAAPIHTENPQGLPAATEGSAPSTSATESATAPQDSPGPATQPDLAGETPPAPPAPPEPGENGVLRELGKSLANLIDAQPEASRRLLQAFLVQHFPGKKAVDLTAEELTLAINIAGGWPQSADRYPIPAADGDIAWEGFSALVARVGEDYVGRCQLCDWELEPSPTNERLPDFRKLELMKQAAQSHETGVYEDGTPWCPGRVQPELESAPEPD